jgi:hypothetical protein
MPRRPIRASEIGQFVFCRRAWWYARRGEVPLSSAELEMGSDGHRAHAVRVRSAVRLQATGTVLLVVAVLLVAIEVGLRWGK